MGLQESLNNLIEYRYRLRVEHNHSDMKWYAYFAGKEQRLLFDKDIDWQTSSDTPSEAVTKLTELVKTKDRYEL